MLWQIPTCYAPVRHVFLNVRLACVTPIASVHSEPGSNSYVSFFIVYFLSVQKGVLPAAGSPTATLLRLHISHNIYSHKLKRIKHLCVYTKMS